MPDRTNRLDAYAAGDERVTRFPVAVVIPAYNAAALITDALDSVAHQQHAPAEIIVVDDGSTDATVATVRRWADENPPAVQLITQANGGTAVARNRGIRAATSDFIALLDADDVMHPDHLATFATLFEQAPDAVLCFADAVRERNGKPDPEGFLAGNALLDLEYTECAGPGRRINGSAYSGLIRGSRIATCSCIFRRQTALGCGLFNEQLRYSEDREFFLRMSRCGTFAYVKRQLSTVRIHGANKEDRGNRGAVRRGRVCMLLEILKNKQEFALSEDEMSITVSEIENTIQKSLFWTATDGVLEYRRWLRWLKAFAPSFTRARTYDTFRACYWTFARFWGAR